VRTLVLTPDFPPAPGGIHLLVHRVVQYAVGLDCRVVTLRQPGDREFDRREGLSVTRIPRAPGSQPVAMSVLNAAAIPAGLAFRPEVVLSMHLVLGPAASAIGRILGVPVVQYFYGAEIGTRLGLTRYAARHATASIAISRYTLDLVHRVSGIRDDVHLIYPGVDLPEYEVVYDRSPPPTVVTVSRLGDRYKGHDVMIRAMAIVADRVPGARWIVIGDGPLRGELTELATSLGLIPDTVVFLGSISDEERDAWLDKSHVFAMPSRMAPGDVPGEGFGIAYLEANAHGCPAVGGNLGGALDAIVDGETGLLVDPDDHEDVARALIGLLEDPRCREAMGIAGAARGREFAWPAIAGQVSELVRQVGSEGRRR
jgi:phosphatidylinositol alpha-1,6-mannosyltransferase